MIDISRIKAITLDLDDTLWPVWPTIGRAEAVLTAWLTAHAPSTAALSADAELKKTVRAEINARHADRAHDLSFLRLQSIRALLQQAGDPVHLAEPAFEAFFAERQRVDLFDDALPALAFWSQRYPVVALSNGNADVHRVGIGQHFHASVSAQSLGVAKPDLRIFVAGAAAAGCATPRGAAHWRRCTRRLHGRVGRRHAGGLAQPRRPRLDPRRHEAAPGGARLARAVRQLARIR